MIRITALAVSLMFLFAFATTTTFSQPYNSVNEKVPASCMLGEINKEILPDALTGIFYSNGHIVFDRAPGYPWEFMATGTGRTGVTVTVDNGIRLQLSHEGALDEYANLRTLGILKMDFQYSSPITKNDTFLMDHDLKESKIRIQTKTRDNAFTFNMWAHPGLDVIALEITIQQPLSEEFNISLLKDYAFLDEVNEEGIYLNWHKNSGSVFKDISHASGVSFQPGDDPLQNRCFGTAICVESEQDRAAIEKKINSGLSPIWTSGLFSMNYAKRIVIWIAAESVSDDEQKWKETVTRRLQAAKSMGLDKFIESHRAWWKAFWSTSWYEPLDQEKYINQIAAYNMYRYYMACSGSGNREFPVRFQNDLFRYQIKNHLWSRMDIHAIETYQIYYGAMRTGDVDALRTRVNHYQKILPAIKESSAYRFDHEGSVSLYESNIWGTYLHNQGQPTRYREDISPYVRYSWQGNLWMIYLMCDYYALTGDKAFAESTIKDFSREVMTFYMNHFPETDNHHKRVFFPASGGETWIGAKNPAEVIVALKATLPRLLEIGKANNWEKELLSVWKGFLKEIPDIPRGRLVMGNDGKWSIEPGDLYVPAEDLSQIDPGKNLNHQQIELFSVWPGKLVLRKEKDKKRAMETLDARYWRERRDGWNLDDVFMACLGQYDSLMADYARRFPTIYTFPCGLARESSPFQPADPWIPYYPSMQGMGTSVIPVFEQLVQDYPDEIILFPCWNREDGIRFRIFSPYAGWIEVIYDPGKTFQVRTDKKIKITLPQWLKNTNPV